MALEGPYLIGQTIRLGNHAASDRPAITDDAEPPVATTPTSAVLTLWKPDAAAPGFRVGGTYGYPDAGTLGTLLLESVGRLYVDVVPVTGEAGRWSCRIEAVEPTVAFGWELVVEEREEGPS